MIFSKKQSYMLAVCDGVISPISEIPDEAFSQGMLGKGYAQEPENGVFRSPVDGVVESIAETKHAYSIHTKNGLDILVHVGVDTVEMKGEGFEAQVSEGQTLTAGDIIARVDIELVKARGFSPITAVLVTNPEKIENIAYKFGNGTGGKDAAMYYSIKK